MAAVVPPPYPLHRSGPVIVCGNAYCLADDLVRATSKFPDCPIIVVNGASASVRGFALFSCHAIKIPKWITLQNKLHDDFEVHSTGIKPSLRHSYPYVDYWWKIKGGGTSTWCARKMAACMGFSPIILCGMPLEIGGYSDGGIARDFRRPRTIDHYRGQILHDTDWHRDVYSMSGWTRKQFGEP